MKRLTKLQANKLRDEGVTVEVFNHSTLGIFNVTEMRKVQLAKPDILKPLEIEFTRFLADGQEGTQAVLDWLVDQREIDEERIAALSPEELEDPVIMVFDMDKDNAAYLIDGIHRMIGRHRRGDKTFKFFPWPLSECPRIDPAAMVFGDIPWGDKDVVGGKLVNIHTGEET